MKSIPQKSPDGKVQSCVNHPPGGEYTVFSSRLLELCGGDRSSIDVASHLCTGHLGYTVLRTPASCADIMRHVLIFRSRHSVKSAIRNLLERNLINEVVYSPSEAVSLLRQKTSIHLHMASSECSWCNGLFLVLQEHHYPISRESGGTETVSICGSCHAEYHYLTENPHYTPAENLLSEFLLLDLPKPPSDNLKGGES